MKKSFFQRFLASFSSQNARNDKRRLVLESLENRTLLSATSWEGFNDPVVNTYQPSGGGDYSFDLVRAVDLSRLADVNGDSQSDFIAWNQENRTIDVYKNDGGDFSLLKSTTFSLASSNFGVQLDDANGDGLTDLIVVYQSITDSTLLTVDVYRGQASGSFATTPVASSLNLTTFADVSSSSTFYAANLDLQLDSATRNLAVHVDGLLSGSGSYSYYSGTAVFAPNGTGTFAASGTPIAASSNSSGVISKSLATVADVGLYSAGSIASTRWIVENNSETKQLVFYKTDGTTTSFTAPTFAYSAATEINGTNLTSLNLKWTVSPAANVLVSGGTLSNGTKGILVSTLTIQGSTVLADNEWIALNDLATIDKPAAFADLNADEAPELVIADSQGVLPLNGTAKVVSFTLGGVAVSVPSFSFSPASRVVSTPNYHSSTLTDLDGDGIIDLLAVGDRDVWFLKGKGDGSFEQAIVLSSDFDTATSKAVFGDFNGDGKTEIAVMMGGGSSTTGGTAIRIYELNSTSFKFIERYTITLTETNGVIPAPRDMVVGKFSQTGKDELAVLAQGSGNYQSVQIFSPYDSFATPAINFDLGSGAAVSIVAGRLFDSALDDLVLLNPTTASLTLLKNSGSKTFASQSVSVQSGSLTVAQSQPIAVALGDVNGDSKVDLVFLNKRTESVAYLGYILQNAAGNFENAAVAVKTSTSYILTGTTPVSMTLNYFNEDSYLDVLIAQTTSEKTSIFAYLGNGESSFYFNAKQTVASQIGVNLTAASAVAVGKINADSSNDLVFVGGKVAAALVNKAQSGGASGRVQILCQSASQEAANYATSVANARTWIDEWSNFYMEVWATTDGFGNIASFQCSLDYNPDYFLVVADSIVPGSGFSLTADVSQTGVVSIAGAATAAQGANEFVLLGRIRFMPNRASGGVRVDLDSCSPFASVENGFSVAPASVELNGESVKTVSSPDSNALRLYPVQFDVDDSGDVTIDDYQAFAYYMFKSVANNPKSILFDSDNDGQITIDDYSEFAKSYAKGANSTADSLNSKDPIAFVAAASALLNDETLAVASSSPSLSDVEVRESTEPVAARLAASVFNDWNRDSDDSPANGANSDSDNSGSTETTDVLFVEDPTLLAEIDDVSGDLSDDEARFPVWQLEISDDETPETDDPNASPLDVNL